MRYLILLCLLVVATPAEATRYWVATTGNDANACSAIDGDEDPGVYKLTPLSAQSCLTAAGDRLTIKGGVYTGASARITAIFSGTVGNPTIVEGDPGDAAGCAITSTCSTILRPTTSNPVYTTDDSYFILRKLDLDAVNFPQAYALRLGNTGGTCTNIVIEDVETHNSGTVNAASGIMNEPLCHATTYRRVHSHHNGVAGGTGGHGLYQQGDNVIIEHSSFHDNRSFGLQCYNSTTLSDGLPNNCIVRYNSVQDNVTGGIALEGNDGQIYRNFIQGNPAGINVGYGGALRTKVVNNTLIDNPSAGISVGVFSSASNSTIHNNIVFGSATAVTIAANSTGVTNTHNACEAAESCGSTGKLTIAAITDILVSSANPTLKSGSAAIGAGTDVGLTACGTADIGAFEAPLVTAASIFGNLLDVTVCSESPPIQPLGTWTPACTGTGCGTPVSSGVALVTGSGGIVRVEVGGITGGNCAASQTWTITASGANTDSALIGGSLNQPLLTTTNFAVDSSACDGSSPSTGYIAGMTIHHDFDGDCDDISGNANHCTTTGSPTFTTAKYGQGMQTTAGATQYATTTYGSGVNPTTQSFSPCVGVYVTPGTESTASIVPFGSPVGTNQRFYVASASGSWRVAAQASNTSTASDLAVVAGWNRVCAVANATTDTITVSNNGVLATTAGGTKTVTSYTLAGAIEVGHLPGNTSADAIYDDFLLYTSAIDVAADYVGWEPPTVIATATQVAHRWHGVYLTSAWAVENRGAANEQRTVVYGGFVALMVQVNNETGSTLSVQPRFRYNINGGDFTNVVPDSPTADGVSYFGMSISEGLNNGIADGPLSGSLTHTDGITLTTSTSVPTLSMADDTSYTLRGIFKIDATVGDVVCFKIYDQGGSALASYTPSAGACVTVITPQGNKAQ